MAELHDLTALELAARVRSRDVSPVEVTEHALRRAERVGDEVGAFATLTPELALDQAQAAQRRLTSGELPPLLGVPCAVKDLNQVAGVPMRMGSAAVRADPSPVDDGVVRLLRTAGTIMIGKTSTPEFGLPCYTEPDTGPPARTPWDLSRSAGGSSGGAAAAVAARIVPVAHGSDGGGSIRIPASACGLVGLKPSRGRVSPGPYGIEGAGLAIGGALTRDVRDTAALLDVLSVGWPGDTYWVPAPRTTFLEACGRDPDVLRIGVLTAPVITADAVVDQACLDAAADSAALLEDLGHYVDTAPVPFPAERWASFEVIWAVMAASVPMDADAEDALTPLTRWLRDSGRSVAGVDYARALAGVQEVTRETALAWADFDVIVSPTLARLPAPVGALRIDTDPAADFRAQCEFTPWTSVWNLTGRPAISLPLHWVDTPEGATVPVGVMLGGRFGAEETLLALSAQLERARPWRDRRPPAPFG